MLRKESGQPEFVDFFLPFGGKLRSDNRWVKLSLLIPWDAVEAEYGEALSGRVGRPALSSRVAFGTLVIKERLGLTDMETVEQIRENPYLQFFLGFGGYLDRLPFDASMLVHFRKRFGEASLGRLIEALLRRAQELEGRSAEAKAEPEPPVANDDDSTKPPPSPPLEPPPAPPTPPDAPSTPTPRGANRGKLIVDATCAPADIRHPNDLSLLNEAREQTEAILDDLYAKCPAESKPSRKPRTYRKTARRRFLRTTRCKKSKARSVIKREKRYQLSCVLRNLRHISQLLKLVPVSQLRDRHLAQLRTILALYRQQKHLLRFPGDWVENHLYSLSQPHVRAIYRGKAGRDFEFGAKLSVSVASGFTFLDRLSWEPFNECHELSGQLDAYLRRFGCYPESVHADKIYHTHRNRRLCKLYGIRLSAPPLDRPGPDAAQQRAQLIQDEKDRNAVEGKFGQLKRRFSLDRVMAKLKATSETAIAMAIFVANLIHCQASGLAALWRLVVRSGHAVANQLARLTTGFSALVRLAWSRPLPPLRHPFGLQTAAA